MSKSINIVSILILVFLFQSCAEQRPLTGGSRDQKPPRIDERKYSTTNYQTNFKDNEVILTFDEWVVLKNPYSKVLISPALNEQPKIMVKHKSVVVRFKEKLRDRTTYTIQFGDAVVDYTEGNPAKDLRFVFSTGDKIDSLKFNGVIVDAKTGVGKEGVWVMLYDNLADSVPKTERPFYIAKTDNTGRFQFENIRKDSFKVFALEDMNSNYLYDPPSESIAFQNTPIWLSDSTEGQLRLRMFKPKEPIRLKKTKVKAKGYAVFEFNQPLQEELIVKVSKEVEYTRLEEDAFVHFWWTTAIDSFQVYLELPTRNWKDTVVLEGLEETKRLKLKLADNNNEAPQKKLTSSEARYLQHGKSTTIGFSQPISSWDSTKIQYFVDSSAGILDRIAIDSLDARKLLITSTTLDGKEHRLLFLPGAVTNIWGQPNEDSIQLNFQVLKEEQLGDIAVKVVNVDRNQSYLFQFLDKQNTVLDEFSFSNVDSLEKKYTKLKADQYTVQVILDTDKNGRWSSGNYDEHQQPEFIVRSKPIALRAGWENELEIDVKVKIKE